MTRVITLCLVIAIMLTSATACRRAWRASRPVRGGARVVRDISRTQDQTSRTAPRPTPDMAKTAITYCNRGNAKYAQGRYEAAIADYNQTISLQPDYASAYHNRGVVKQNLGKCAAAIADNDEAIRLQPDLADAYDYRDIAKRALDQTE